jgi:hypothetical protein
MSGLGGCETGLGSLHVFGAALCTHVLEPSLLLRQTGLRGCDILCARPGLQGGQTRLSLSQVGTRLKDLHRRVVLVEHGDRVTCFNLTVDVDQNPLDAACTLG